MAYSAFKIILLSKPAHSLHTFCVIRLGKKGLKIVSSNDSKKREM